MRSSIVGMRRRRSSVSSDASDSWSIKEGFSTESLGAMPDTEDSRKACPDEVCSTSSKLDDSPTNVVDDDNDYGSCVAPSTTDGSDEASEDDDGGSDPSRVS